VTLTGSDLFLGRVAESIEIKKGFHRRQLTLCVIEENRDHLSNENHVRQSCTPVILTSLRVWPLSKLGKIKKARV
jgi:hypothetical protein